MLRSKLKPQQNTEPFNGFALPTSNTTYTPNQFFDVCLPHYSRGVVRLMAYMIRKTLGWCDAEGRPQHETVTFSYADLEKHAGLSHSMIRRALDEAVAGGFIHCVQAGRANNKAIAGQAAIYELAWDESGEYVKDPQRFKGFFAGDGNRTYIPNQFFDHLVPNEPLAMIQTVGAVIRFSIGFANKYGHRRQRVALSYQDIQRYAKIRSPRILATALRQAIGRNYIERLEEGYFDPNAGRLSRAAHYALKWAQFSAPSDSTPKSEAGKMHTEKFSGNTPKSEAAEHSEKVSGIQIKQTNNILKQQATVVGTFERLKAAGFDDRTAEAIAARHPAERIERQLRWIGQRRATSNRLGMLRAAIEQDWAEPAAPGTPRDLRQRKFQRREVAPEGRGRSFAEALDATRRRLT